MNWKIYRINDLRKKEKKEIQSFIETYTPIPYHLRHKGRDEEYFTKIYFRKGAMILLIRNSENQICGFSGVSKRFRIKRVYVVIDKSLRKKGIANKICRRIMKERPGFYIMTIDKKNFAGIRLLKGLGFKFFIPWRRRRYLCFCMYV